MKAALVADWYLPRVGGIELHVHELATRLRARDHDVTVITAWPGPPEVDGVPVVRLPVSTIPLLLGVSLSPRLVPLLRAIIRPGAFDLVHVHHSIGSPTAMAAAYVAGRAKTPVLATLHSMVARYKFGYDLTAWIFGWRQWPFQVTAVSEAVARDLRGIMPERPVRILPNAVDTDAWTPLPDTTEPGRLRLVTTARLNLRKRVGALIRILGTVRAQVAPDVDVTLEVLGDGPRRKSVDKRVRELGLGGAVRLLGSGTASDVRTLLGRGDVFVNACYEESFGIASLEAHCRGLPVVARAGGGTDSFIRDGVNGVLVNSDEEMATALVELARSPERLRKLRRAAVESPKGRFSWDESIRRHERLYRELVGPPEPGGTSASERQEVATTSRGARADREGA